MLGGEGEGGVSVARMGETGNHAAHRVGGGSGREEGLRAMPGPGHEAPLRLVAEHRFALGGRRQRV